MWKQSAQRAEADGYDWITVSDHVIFATAPIATMMAMAAATSTLRVSTNVLDNNFRHPVILAKEAAMIDVLSDGRLELGIGAGSLPFEHSAFLDIKEEPVGVRIRRLEEALFIIKGMWGPTSFSLRGEFYCCEPLDGLPKPVQEPHPPIRLGGFGKRLLSVGGREADIVNILLRSWPNSPSAPPATRFAPAATTDPNTEYGHMSVPIESDLIARIDWIRVAAGDRFDDIELELFMFACVVSDKPSETARRFIPLLGKNVEQVLAAPDVAIGSVNFIADRLLEIRDKFGISSFLGVPPPVVAALAGA